MDKDSFFPKLSDGFTTVFIGVLVGLPAIGIIVPQLFAMLGEIPGQQIDGIFRVFAMLYFSMPLILLFVWSFFQFNNRLFKSIRPLISVGIIILAEVFTLMLLVLKGGPFFQLALPWIVVALIIIAWASCWFSFITIKNKLVAQLDSPVHKRLLLAERNKTLASLRLLIFYLFAVNHLIVMLSMSYWYLSDGTVLAAIVLVLLYLPVLLYYLADKDLRKLRRNGRLSRSLYPELMLLAIAVISVVIFMTGDQQSFPAKATVSVAEILNAPPVIQKQIILLDADYRERAATRDTEIEQQLPYNYLRRLMQAPVAGPDSLLRYKRQMHRYALLENVNDSSCPDKPLYIFLRAQRQDTVYILGVLKQLGRLSAGHAQNKIKLLLKDYKHSPQVAALNYKLSADSLSWGIDQAINREIRAIKLQHLVVGNDRAAETENLIIKNTQRTGVVIFLSTLAVALIFLMMLSYNDDRFHRETMKEVRSVRQSLETVCLIIVILLIPLLKTVPKDAVDPSRPESLFLLANWNLKAVFKTEEAEGARTGARHDGPRYGAPAPGDDGGGDDPASGEGSKTGNGTCSRCCADSIRLKITGAKDTVISRLIIDWSLPQQNEQRRHDSVFRILVEKLRTTTAGGADHFQELQGILSGIGGTLNSSNSYESYSSQRIDTVIKRLDSIRVILARSAFKTGYFTQTKP